MMRSQKSLSARCAVVVIGRNEGQRLIRCLKSLSMQDLSIVYVDSGSTDDSVSQARNHGVMVAELDLSCPFTAARARNTGVEALLAAGLAPGYLQFIDGDCILEAGWLSRALEAFDQDPELGVVTGWRSEIYPNKSVYNALCDFEWRRPAGEIEACGGDMMVRTSTFRGIGGFNSSVIAAEDDEFCLRVRKAGWRIYRLPLPMTKHDASMTSFGEWWRRAVRSGHGFAQVGQLHPEYFRRERLRVIVFGALLPLFSLIALVVHPAAIFLFLSLYLLSYGRTVLGLKQSALDTKTALHHGVFLMLSKFPNTIGMSTYFWRRSWGRKITLIEYK